MCVCDQSETRARRVEDYVRRHPGATLYNRFSVHLIPAVFTFDAVSLFTLHSTAEAGAAVACALLRRQQRRHRRCCTNAACTLAGPSAPHESARAVDCCFHTAGQVESISVGDQHACLIARDTLGRTAGNSTRSSAVGGNVTCWGDDKFGRCITAIAASVIMMMAVAVVVVAAAVHTLHDQSHWHVPRRRGVRCGRVSHFAARPLRAGALYAVT